MPAARERDLRLFVAIYPPPELARAMLDALNDLELPEHRLTPVEQVHLTLQFIGNVPQQDLESTVESIEHATGGLAAFEMTPKTLIALPMRGPARLVAAETDAHATLLEIQRRLATRLARRPRHNAGDRFRPHLTLCRFKKPSRIARADRALSLPGFAVTRVVLMRSTLTQRGAEHAEVAAWTLPRRR
ncbi:MAG: RNA 2',3'-cyclic phosphodiesterase [Planctomycetota bacterium]|jgi:2'-5' RNA ligase